MPVTKTAKRALRGSARKKAINDSVLTRLEIALRQAKKVMTQDSIKIASSLADIAAKKKVIHKNKAARIKSQLSKLVSAKKPASKKPKSKKTSPKKKASKK